ncbi:MAG TPA: PadR family transcriptional regulator [Gemmatimonadaceae bacterium]|jgi:DNA-binding PadR family transcriptional regulator|nr:PadR family transcriptional regulator [Gemmatimonadaceae bacterium]
MIRYIDNYPEEDLMHQNRDRHRGGRRAFGESERGSIKYDILSILWDGPRHGYDLMLTIEEQRGFRPSPGSIYPALQMLEEGDFLTGKEIGGKRVYTITDKGSELLAKHRETTPDAASDPAGTVSLIARSVQTMVGIKMVLKELGRTRNVEMYTQALAILERTRRDLYALLTHE